MSICSCFGSFGTCNLLRYQGQIQRCVLGSCLIFILAPKSLYLSLPPPPQSAPSPFLQTAQETNIVKSETCVLKTKNVRTMTTRHALGNNLYGTK